MASVTRERQAVGSRLGEKKVHWELLLYVGTDNCLNKSLGAKGTTGLQGRRLSWKERWFSTHCPGYWDPIFMELIVKCGTMNVH